jgi:hypothetical protein
MVVRGREIQHRTFGQFLLGAHDGGAIALTRPVDDQRCAAANSDRDVQGAFDDVDVIGDTLLHCLRKAEVVSAGPNTRGNQNARKQPAWRRASATSHLSSTFLCLPFLSEGQIPSPVIFSHPGPTLAGAAQPSGITSTRLFRPVIVADSDGPGDARTFHGVIRGISVMAASPSIR